MLERIHGRVKHLGREEKFEKRKRSDQRIQERISARHRGYGETRTQERNV